MSYFRQFFLLTCAFVFVVALSKNDTKRDKIEKCIRSSTTVSALADCLGRLTLSQGITSRQWAYALPSNAQRRAIAEVIGKMLDKDQCDRISVPAVIERDVQVRSFLEKYCILVEKRINSTTGTFNRMWVFFATPIKGRRVRRPRLHHSCAHTVTDGNVAAQSAALFENTSSQSLVVSLAQRKVTRSAMSRCEPKYYPADGAHDTKTMFHAANLAVYDWQQAQRGACTNANCAFIQWHGMRSTSCPSTAAFFAAGLARYRMGPGDVFRNPQAPVVRMKKAINDRWKAKRRSWKARLPTESNCNLVASSNIFGRIINGVSRERACTENARTANGHFVHIESKFDVQMLSAFRDWEVAIYRAFPLTSV